MSRDEELNGGVMVAGYMKRTEALKRGKTMFDFMRPAGSVAVIVAWYEISDCDPPADYFNVKCGPTHLLAWSDFERDSFPEMRRAAESYERAYHLRLFDRGAEYRRKYADGHGAGNFLKRGGFYDTGWKIRKWLITKWSMDEICLALAKGRFHFSYDENRVITDNKQKSKSMNKREES